VELVDVVPEVVVAVVADVSVAVTPVPVVSVAIALVPVVSVVAEVAAVSTVVAVSVVSVVVLSRLQHTSVAASTAAMKKTSSRRFVMVGPPYLRSVDCGTNPYLE
jgi:hypothetical protein